MSEQTQPSNVSNVRWDPTSSTQPVHLQVPRRRRRPSIVALGLILGLALAIYFLIPNRRNILLLGIDRAPDGTALSRTDTMILTTVKPLEAYIGMLSIPRDLWVQLPTGGEGRINSAHFFAENAQSGSGPDAAKEVVQQNFGVDVHYFVRFQFDGFVDFIDALGGVPIELEQPMAGYAAGTYTLNGQQALAFVRDRKGTDDFFRMDHGQLFIKAILRHMLKPGSWIHLPVAIPSLITAMDTDIPFWLWPRIGLALLREGPDGIDFHMISREMVQGFITDQGAQVLAPDWSRINPVLMEVFGQ
jgi:LCP family protein required for cell wall assembly